MNFILHLPSLRGNAGVTEMRGLGIYMKDWQPIETAPKDGTVVRLLCNAGGKLFEASGHYLDLGAWREAGKNSGLLMPTHWMHLPNDGAT